MLSAAAAAASRASRALRPARRRRLSGSAQPLVELREYALHPEHAGAYLRATAAAADLRRTLLPLRLFATPDAGGALHVATHAYHYAGGHAERDARRAAAAASPAWAAYLDAARPCVQAQRASLFVEAPLVASCGGGLAAARAEAPAADCAFEMRRYKLVLGYETVPQFLALYGTGLPSKLAAPGTDEGTSLVTLMYTEVGRLNEVVEVWRHGNGTAGMERSRVAARGAKEWRDAVQQIAPLAVEFTTSILTPTAFSPIR